MVKCLTSESQSNYKILTRVFYKCSNLHTYFDANHKLLNTNTISPSYTEIHKVYMSLFKQEPINTTKILDQSLWLNQNISINNKYVYLKKNWENKGISYLRDILNGKCEPLMHNELKQKYHINTTFLQTTLIHKCIPKQWLCKLKNGNTQYTN